MRHLLASAALLALSPIALASPLAAQDGAAMTDETAKQDLTFERVFASPSLNGPSPRGAKLSPDGRYLTLLRNREDDKDRYDLWGFDRETGEWTMLVDSEKLSSGRELSEDEKMQRERARVGNLKGIVSYQWNADSKGVLVPLDGDLYLAKLDGTVTQLTDTEESELNPKLSQEGGYVSFVRDRQLWVAPIGGDAHPITPKEGELIRWGEAEFVAQVHHGVTRQKDQRGKDRIGHAAMFHSRKAQHRGQHQQRQRKGRRQLDGHKGNHKGGRGQDVPAACPPAITQVHKLPDHAAADRRDQQVKPDPAQPDRGGPDGNHRRCGEQPRCKIVPARLAHAFTAPYRRSRPPKAAQRRPSSSGVKSGQSVSMNSYSA